MVQIATYGRKTAPIPPQYLHLEDAGDDHFIGINNLLAPDKVPPGFLANAQNCRFRDDNASTRLGVVKPGWVNDTTGGGAEIDPPGQFYGIGGFKDPNSFEWVLEAVAGGVYRHKEHNTRVSLPLPTGVKILTRSQFVQAFNRVFLFRGRHLAPLVMADVDLGFVDIEPQWSAATVYNTAILATGQVADEVAYGPFQAVTSIISIGTTAVVTTTAEHGFITGADVTISGAVETAYNGRFNIVVIDNNTFTYVTATTPSATPATGTITCSNMAFYYKALGSLVTLTSLTHSTVTATATKTAHGFTTGQYATILGATPAAYNGTFIITVTGANTFTYVMASDPAANATGTITAQTSVVLAGQSPNTNAEAWQRIFNVLPNADDALYINNQMLVPTAYTPGDSAYDSSSTYTKTDYLVAMNYLDPVHFDFVDDFRINQGSDDEIVCLVKYSADVAICFKGKSFAIISNISLDLTQISVDMHPGYGATGNRSAVVAGKNVLFMSRKRGVCSLIQNEVGQVRSVDIPFSNDVPEIINRINWNAADQIRVEWWDDKLYVAVPLNNSVPVLGPDLVSTQGVVQTFPPQTTLVGGFAVGQKYRFTAGPGHGLSTGYSYIPPLIVFLPPQVLPGDFVATATSYYLHVNTGTNTVQSISPGLNNAILVYDFRAGENGSWSGVDTGAAICPMEFLKATNNGLERLFFAGVDNFVSLVEEAFEGDQVQDDTAVNGLSFTAISDSRTSRGYRFDSDAQKAFQAVQLVAETWNPQFSIARNSGAAGSTATVLANKTFSRTAYLRPFNRAAYDVTNVNGDFATGGRGDYSIPLDPAGVYLDGVSPEMYQEFTVRQNLRPLAGRYCQFTITNTQGRFNLKSITPTTAEGQRRTGILI